MIPRAVRRITTREIYMERRWRVCNVTGLRSLKLHYYFPLKENLWWEKGNKPQSERCYYRYVSRQSFWAMRIRIAFHGDRKTASINNWHASVFKTQKFA